jgi:hypothetical protein
MARSTRSLAIMVNASTGIITVQGKVSQSINADEAAHEKRTKTPKALSQYGI